VVPAGDRATGKGVAVRHVIFDIGGVLINYDFRRLASALSGRTDQDPRRLLALLAQDVVHEVETGRTDPEDFFHRVMAPLLPGMTYDDWIGAWADNYSVNAPGWALLEDARESGRTVSLLSNLAHYNQLAIERKFPDFFRTPHHSFYSYELGFQKPDPRIYEAVCQALGVAPDECFFLDDLEENVRSAREVGMGALRFQNERIPEIREALGLQGAPGASAAALGG
jgi:HAD superfamily hydrolase (TIGR01509 family)